MLALLVLVLLAFPSLVLVPFFLRVPCVLCVLHVLSVLRLLGIARLVRVLVLLLPILTSTAAALLSSFPTFAPRSRQHLDTVNAWPDPNRLIEAHGRLGLFKCVSGDTSGDEDEGEEGEGENECPYSYDKEIRPSAFPESVCATLEDDGCVAAARGLSRSLTEVPRYAY